MGILKLILLFLPYLLIPSFLVYLTKRFSVSSVGFTYLLNVFLIFLYPFLLFWIDQLVNPGTIKCLNPEFAIVLFNTIVMIPVCLLLQYILNAIFKD